MWKGNRFYYSSNILRVISQNYLELYDGLSFRENNLLTNPNELAEYKADFDNSLRSLGRGNWSGQVDREFKQYTNYNKLQRIVIADIMSIPDEELTRMRFNDIMGIREYAYYRMKKFLNGGDANVKEAKY